MGPWSPNPEKQLALKTVTGAPLEHHGVKRAVPLANGNGGTLFNDFHVTSCARPVLSVRERCRLGQMVVFGPIGGNIISYFSAARAVEHVLNATRRFDIREVDGQFVLDCDPVSAGFVAPVLQMPRWREA